MVQGGKAQWYAYKYFLFAGLGDAIQSLLCLWEELCQYQNVKFLLTGRLNQDSLENLFSVIRGKGEHRDNPDSQGRIQDFLQGGGSTMAVYSGRLWRPRRRGGSRVDKHQIKVHSVHRIFRAIFFLFLLYS